MALLDDARIAFLAQRVMELTHGGESPQGLAWDSLSRLVLFEVSIQLARVRNRGPRKGGLPPRKLALVTEYLRAHLQRSVSLAELADLARLSPYHFCRSFRLSVGHPPHRYLTILRIEEARRLLAETERPLVDIALDVGFQSPQALSRAFRKEAGESPTAFRWRHRR